MHGAAIGLPIDGTMPRLRRRQQTSCSGRDAVIVVEQPAQALPVLDCVHIGAAAQLRIDDPIVESLVIAFFQVQLSNTTPILVNSVKSATSGIPGMVGLCRYMPAW